MKRRVFVSSLAAAAFAAIPVLHGAAQENGRSNRLARINHIAVVYEENHGFDDLSLTSLVVTPFLRGDFVDHTAHDTTSIPATIERRFGLSPLSTRDAAVRDLSSVYSAKSPNDDSVEARGR